ncbi:serine/threonine-protein phosphatase [Nonomuraea sp. MG754425]|uniref:PP2C family protein-serine/threonine phosphatase n=1 Tax=Nonomuraea sp. MG754425 TaxID=2570319 RepID=UPI001F213410|nr:PP2C family protein-serine/threonine phosphatase [Nonomuraea sp. MG754425]MCF6471508.1 serine/threonine-protein phosphatase [Nonomuraea sp. MG754425]
MVRTVWEDAPYPMLEVSTAGVVEQANKAARALLAVPPARPVVGERLERTAPQWLSQAHHLLSSGHGAGGAGPGREAPYGRIGERVYQAHAVCAAGDRAVWWLVDVTAQQRALRSLRDWAGFITEAGNELLPSLNLDRCLETTACLAARRLADVALVVLPLSGRRYAIARCGPRGEPVREDLDIDPRTLPGLAEALQGFPPVPTRWTAPADVPGWVLRDGSGAAGSVAVTALPGHGLPAGALVLVRGTRAGFSEHEGLFVRLFAMWAGSAISVARLYAEQAVVSETLLAELLPPPTPDLEGVELAALYRPAGQEERVGGDFYDVYPAAGTGGESLVVLGDVAGKGLEAAVLTGRIRNTLRALLPLADDHQRVLELLNGVLVADGDPSRYVTLVLASFEHRGSRVALRLTSAGHPAPLILRNDGRVETVPAVGTLIGVLEDVTSVTDSVVLEPGETCLLYSDGIIEARGGPLGSEFLGEERLGEHLRQCAGMPPEALAERVQMLASQWAGEREHDDMAVVAISAPRAARKDTRDE